MTTVSYLGIVCILAAIVGGGFKGLGVEIPIIKTWPRQLLLALAGMLLVTPAAFNKIFPPVNAEQLLVRGLRAYDDGQFQMAFNDFKRAAEVGHPIAEYHYGEMLIHGEGVVPNEALGVRWVFLSGKHGYPLAQASIAAAYLEGRAVQRDLREAKRWATLGANQNSSYASYILAIATTDFDEKMTAIRKSAEGGYAPAQVALGEVIGNSGNLEESLAWMNKAALQGHPEAQVSVGRSLMPFKPADAYLYLSLALKESGHHGWKLSKEQRATAEVWEKTLEKSLPPGLIMDARTSKGNNVLPLKAECSYRHGHDD